MHEARAEIPIQINTRRVLLRIVFRLVLMAILATISSKGFGRACATLLTLLAVFCAVVGAMRGELIYGPALTHWDESAMYAIIAHTMWAFV